MKKVLTLLIAAIAATAMCVCIAACGNGQQNAAAGTYKYYAVVINGETKYVTDPDVEVTEDYIVIVLNADGTGEQKMQVSETNTVSVPLEWKLEGTELKITANGATSSCTLENDIISIDIMGNKAMLKKSA